jgi:TPR repeat protein
MLDIIWLGRWLAARLRQGDRLLPEGRRPGQCDAQYDLGWAYENGLGVPKDRQQAIEWYSKAAGSGHSNALRSLDRLSERASVWSALRQILPF